MTAIVMQEDPMCGDAEAVCGSCHFRHKCDYLSSGQVALCSTVIAEMEDEYPTELGLNARLERCFEKMISNAKSYAR